MSSSIGWLDTFKALSTVSGLARAVDHDPQSVALLHDLCTKSRQATKVCGVYRRAADFALRGLVRIDILPLLKERDSYHRCFAAISVVSCC